jgi:hypothetical protein
VFSTKDGEEETMYSEETNLDLEQEGRSGQRYRLSLSSFREKRVGVLVMR